MEQPIVNISISQYLHPTDFQLVGLNISLEPEFVIETELADLIHRVKELGLSKEQQVKVMEVRKKGKNNNNARQCRKKKLDKVASLQVTELSPFD